VIALPHDYFLIAWSVLAGASTAYVAVDRFKGNPEPTVMKWDFILVSSRAGGRPDAGPGRALKSRFQQLKGNAMLKKTSMVAVTMIVASLCGSAAYAHPELRSAEPAAGAATTSPKQIKITFNENVVPQFSGIEVKDQTGKVIATGKATTDPTNKKQLVVPVQEQLPPGDYKVEWHAVSDDTHRVKGSYLFSVDR